jgi:phosphohistidine swiveling domain-containing protein
MLLRGHELLDPAVAGNKFARLEEMRLAGLPVPALFCLSAEAFDVASKRLRDGLPPVPPAGDVEAVRAWSSAAADRAAALEVPEDLALAALEQFDDVIGASSLAAVRACVVPAPGQPGEDDVSDPFAGMSESFLYVPREELLARVVGCWASAYRPEAVLYRLHRGGDPMAARIAVGVQRMVLGTRSFVAFTRDPRDGARRVVIAAAHGIGEGVVQEKADVDHFFVHPETGEVSAELVTKRRMVGPPVGGELSIMEVPAELAEGPVLEPALCNRIAAVAARIEELFGCPQDIEGTLAEGGELFIVQARPMVLPDAPETLVSWSNHNITESFPGVSGTLTFSLARDFYRLIFADMYRRMGVPERTIRRNAHHLERMIGTLDGRIYYRIDAWYALHGQMRAFELFRGWWEHGMGLAESPDLRLGRGWRRRALRAAPGLITGMVAQPGEVRNFLRWWDELCAAANDRIDRATPEELISFYRGMWAEVGVRWGVTLTNSVHIVLSTLVLDALLRRWAGQRDHGLMIGLLSGARPNRSLLALRAAIGLAELIQANPRARAAVLGEEDQAALWQRIVAGHYGTALRTAATEYLRRFGDRAAGDLKLEEPTPRQRPWMVLDLVRSFVRQGLTVADNEAGERRVRAEADRQLRESCPHPVRRGVIRLAAAALRRFTKAREDTRFCRTELYGLSRRVLFRLGAELVAAGHLDHAHDVIDLSVPEVLGAFDGTLGETDLRELAAERRAVRERQATLPAPPGRLVTAAGRPLAIPRPAATEESTEDSTVLRGLASSRGVVRARAKVVLNPSSVPPDSCQDAILVARETDPGWLFLMTAAKGLIVERGTLLSHTAITGRLLGVPTVVAVSGATTRIPDGALVELDGAAGTVRILEEPT